MHCTYPGRIGENRHGEFGLCLELREVVHEILSLHAPHTAVVGALQLLTKVNHFSGHVRYTVFQLMELTEGFLNGKHKLYALCPEAISM